MHLSRLIWAVLLQVGLDLVRESGVDPAAHAGACTVSAGVGAPAAAAMSKRRKGKRKRKKDCGLISTNIESIFAKWSEFARSGPCVHPIRWPRKAGDVATLAAHLLLRESY